MEQINNRKLEQSEEEEDELLETRFSHRVSGQFWFERVMYNRHVSPQVLEGLPTMQPRPDDCLLMGYPKSGTTWIQEVVWLLRNKVNVAQSREVPTYIRIPHLESPHTQMVDDCPNPRTLKSHIQPRYLPRQVSTMDTKIVFVLRNPKDVAVSYFHFYKSFSGLGRFQGSWEEFLQMFLAGYVACGSWFEHTSMWWPMLNQPNICVIMYEDMKLKPRKTIDKLATFLEKQVTCDDVDVIMNHTSFDSMRDNPMTNFKTFDQIDDSISPFIRKGKVGDWQRHFTVEQNNAFDQILEDRLGHTNLRFTFSDPSGPIIEL